MYWSTNDDNGHPAMFAQAMQEGSLINVIAGHGNAEGIFSMSHEGRSIWLTTGNAGQHLRGDTPTAPLVFLACNCGEFNRPRAAIAETMLFLRGGPVAAIGATTESHPLTNYFTGVGAELSGNTPWGLLNAATELASHQRVLRGASELQRSERRFESLLLGGSAQQFEQQAFEAACALLDAA